MLRRSSVKLAEKESRSVRVYGYRISLSPLFFFFSLAPGFNTKPTKEFGGVTTRQSILVFPHLGTEGVSSLSPRRLLSAEAADGL